MSASAPLTSPIPPRSSGWPASSSGCSSENGFSGPNPSCRDAEVCPGPALSDFVVGGDGPLTPAARFAPTLAELPAYDLRQVAPVDPETGRARRHGAARLRHPRPVAGGPAGADRAGARRDRRAWLARRAAAGVDVELAGLPVIAAAAASDLSGSRYWLTLAGLLAVALVLLAVYRSPRRALVPLVPIVLATGWSALVLWVSGIPLNPMSAALGALMIAIAHRVQRHPRGPLPRGAGRRALGRRRRCAAPTRAPAPPCSPPA